MSIFQIGMVLGSAFLIGSMLVGSPIGVAVSICVVLVVMFDKT